MQITTGGKEEKDIRGEGNKNDNKVEVVELRDTTWEGWAGLKVTEGSTCEREWAPVEPNLSCNPTTPTRV